MAGQRAENFPAGWSCGWFICLGYVCGLCGDEVGEEAGEVDVGGVVGEFLAAGGGFGCVGVDVWWWFGWVGDVFGVLLLELWDSCVGVGVGSSSSSSCGGCGGGCSEAGVVVPEGEDLVVVGGDCPVLGVEFVVVVLAEEYEVVE